MVTFNINSDAARRHTERLRRLHRSALPVAIRGTLNRAAFDVKQNTMPESAKSTFVQRAPNFFKANSRVEKATGFSVSAMKATVGFIPKGGTDFSVDDLKQQEYGGNIGGRTMIPLKQARLGGSWNKRVRESAKIKQVRGKMIDPKDAGPRNNNSVKQSFIKSAVHAGKGGLIRGTGPSSDIVFKIITIKQLKGNTIIKLGPLYSLKKGRNIRPKATHFMQKASLLSARKMEAMYAQEAQKQIDRLR